MNLVTDNLIKSGIFEILCLENSADVLVLSSSQGFSQLSSAI